MKNSETLIVFRSDLNPNNMNFDDVDLDIVRRSIKTSICPNLRIFSTNDIVLFVESDLRTKIIKNRFGNPS